MGTALVKALCAAHVWLPWAVNVVEVSLEVEGKKVPVRWQPGLDDLEALVQRVAPGDDLDINWNLPVKQLVESLKVTRALMVNRSYLNASSLPLKRAQRTKEVPEEEENILAVHMGHDSSIAVSRKGRVQCVLELERLFGKRYHRPPINDAPLFLSQWEMALRRVRNRCNCEDGWRPAHFQHAVVIKAALHETAKDLLVQALDQQFSIERFHYVDHHEAHALSGFLASPFRTALIASYDGAGNDGNTNIYMGSFSKVWRIAQLDYSLGSSYEMLAILLPEVSGIPLDEYFDCNVQGLQGVSGVSGLVAPKRSWFNEPGSMSWAGKLMGYAATGSIRDELRHHVSFIYEASNAYATNTLERFPVELVRFACESVQNQRDLAATLQSEFEYFLLSKVDSLLTHVGPQKVEGIVLTGGCALNVLANQLIYDTFTKTKDVYEPAHSRGPLGVYVSPAPNDSGLTLGALWAVTPPTVRQPLQYLGFDLWDKEFLPRYVRMRRAKSLSELGGIEYLADLLSGGEPWIRQRNGTAARPIIAVVRGRQEVGPRALGHRSLLAVPDGDMRDRMNRLKVRQWYRPVAPMIAEEALHQVFGREVLSPFMSMAPKVLPEVGREWPSLVHLDGTARHQSVSPSDEPWIHTLLLAVGKRTGLAALINTSFNTKGKPIVNTVRESLRMLDTLPDLDYLVIEDWLFRKHGR